MPVLCRRGTQILCSPTRQRAQGKVTDIEVTPLNDPVGLTVLTQLYKKKKPQGPQTLHKHPGSLSK